jgi:hypothetical protein
MTSILKVDTIQDTAGNNIINESGDTITIGASGDVIVVPAGSAAAPVITTTGDTNTGIFFPAADTIAFTEGGTEAMRITSAGQISTTINASGTNTHEIYQSSDNPFGIFFHFSGASPDNNNNYFLRCFDQSGTNRLFIYSDGDVQNHDNSYGSISDERIKQDIRDSNSQWNDIKNIKVRNFKKKDDVRQYGENAWEQIGLVAQELEIVSPKLIKHSDPSPSDILSDSSFGTLYEEGDEIPEGKKIGDVKEIYEQVKSVSYSVLYMKAIKALQEAMERIETLEAKVTTLENN